MSSSRQLSSDSLQLAPAHNRSPSSGSMSGVREDGGAASVPPAGSPPTASSAETKGWLYKWTNYIKGYQKRWFVLSNGLLFYYRSQAEMSHTCRGTISLQGANIHTEDSCNFIVSNGGGTQTFHLRASSEVERQRWVTALELAKAQALRARGLLPGGHSEGEEDAVSGGADGGHAASEAIVEITKQELDNVVKALSVRLEDLLTCSNLIGEHGAALQASLNDLSADRLLEHLPPDNKQLFRDRVKTVTERAALLKITSNAMVKASTDFVQNCQSDGRRWQRILTSEREIRQRLEDMVEQLAKQHSHLEQMVRNAQAQQKELEHQNNRNQNSSEAVPDSALAAGTNSSSGDGIVGERSAAASSTAATSDDDDDDFHDAVDEINEFEVPAPPSLMNVGRGGFGSGGKSESGGSKDDDFTDDEGDETDSGAGGGGVGGVGGGGGGDKKKIHVFQKKGSNSQSNASDLTQPMTESATGRPARQRRLRVPDRPDKSINLWSIVKNCIGKDLTKIPVPVNFSEPLSFLQRLTEDYVYAEILHRAAMCKDNYEQMAMVAAFSVSSYATTAIRPVKPFNPLLGETFECDRSDDMGWRCLSEQVSHHPPMVGQYCEATSGKWKAWQEFSMRSKFKGKYIEVEPLGIHHCVFTESGNHYTWRKVKTVVHNIVIGKLWVDQHGEMSVINHSTNDKCHMKFDPYSYFGGTPKKVTGTIVSNKEKVEYVINGTWDSKLEGSPVIAETVVKGKSSLEIGPTKTLWRLKPLRKEAEKYYFFSDFAASLNEMEEGVAPTDSRLRPDQRMMEDALWDEANDEKVRLEEKQRATRRDREAAEQEAAREGRHFEGYQPSWFKREPDEQNGGKYLFSYQGGYWEAKEKQQWDKCPDIY